MISYHRAMLRDHPLTIERREGRTASTLILVLSGPLTLTNVFLFQDEVRSGELPKTAILDLSAVPYMDSGGIGAVINYFVHCQKGGAKLIVAGVSDRVLELFKLTGANTVIPLVETVEQAEALT